MCHPQNQFKHTKTSVVQTSDEPAVNLCCYTEKPHNWSCNTVVLILSLYVMACLCIKFNLNTVIRPSRVCEFCECVVCCSYITIIVFKLLISQIRAYTDIVNEIHYFNQIYLMLVNRNGIVSTLQ